MNESHPSGAFPPDTSHGFSYPVHDGGQYEQAGFDTYAQQGAQQAYSTGYDGWSTGSYDNLAHSYGDSDPLFGSMPGTYGTHDAYAGNGGYDTGTYDTGGYSTGHYDTTGYGSTAYDTGSYDTGTAWTNADHTNGYGYAAGHTGGWETGHWNVPADNGSWGTGQQEAAAVAAPEADPYAAAVYDNATVYDNGAVYDNYAYAYDDPSAQGLEHHQLHEPQDGHEPGAAEGYGVYEQQPLSYEEPFAHDGDPNATAAYPTFDGAEFDATEFDSAAFDSTDFHDALDEAEFGTSAQDDVDMHDVAQDATLPPPPQLRGRRRSPKPRRSALLTVAVPSVAVMGVAGVAAATVVGSSPDSETTTTQASAPDTAVKPANTKLDTQLAGLSADADDFADRASRTQERIDLKERQEAEKERKAKEAARKEAMRPKFALPVKQHGLSAQYGQAGLNWMSVHTGIDFPVDEGTPVMAATDGTVTTKYDMSFGNMAVVTAPDGTETWYCHLSSTKIRSGTVKAGDTIGYSGSSGNSTGPHLHFEVHPGGGEAIDPLPWLRAKGLDPA